MSLGEEWGAIVLLDEADVYLESRAVSEVKRDSLVSGESFFGPTYQDPRLNGTSLFARSRILQRSTLLNNEPRQVPLTTV